MKSLTRLLFFVIILVLVVPLSLPAALAQDGGDPVRDEGGVPVISLDGDSPVPEHNTIIDLRDPEMITGDDNMKRLSSTTGNPWRATAKVTTIFPGGTVECTGFFIDPVTVVTSGHCVYDPAADQSYTNMTITPGLNGTVAPFGSVNETQIASVDMPPQWTTPSATPPWEWDLAVITLSDATVGTAVGTFFTLAYVDDWTLWEDFGKLTINGYPVGKAYNGVFGMTQWKDQDYLVDDDGQWLFYRVDTANQYGSPIWGSVKGSPNKYVVGIHTREGDLGECNDYWGGTFLGNCGIYINEDVATWLDDIGVPYATTDVDGLIPTSPVPDVYNQKKQAFSWAEETPGTYVKYQFELWQYVEKYDKNGNYTSTDKLKTRKTTTKTSLTLTLGPTGIYEWYVRGIQANGLPGPWEESGLFLDVTKPLAPILLLPVNKSTVVGPDVTLSWDAVIDEFHPLSDNLVGFEVQIKPAGGDWAVYTPIPAEDLPLPLGNGTYQWRVRAIDWAGNLGKWSKVFKFTVTDVLSLPEGAIGPVDAGDAPLAPPPVISLDEGSAPVISLD